MCQKQSQPYMVLSHAPEDALARAQQVVGQYPHSGNRNLLYLHYVGELLRSASCVGEGWEPSQAWFLSALMMFHNMALSEMPQHSSEPLQLALFETQVGYEGKDSNGR